MSFFTQIRIHSFPRILAESSTFSIISTIFSHLPGTYISFPEISRNSRNFSFDVERVAQLGFEALIVVKCTFPSLICQRSSKKAAIR